MLNEAWIKDFSWDSSNTAEGVITDVDGNIYVGGGTGLIGEITLKAQMVKLDPDGNLIWEKQFTWGDGVGTNYVGKFLIDADNNIYVLGVSTASGGWPDSQWQVDKIDPDGNVIWSSSFNWTPNNDQLTDAVFDQAGNLCVLGAVNGVNNHPWKFVKLDQNGNQILNTDITGTTTLYSFGSGITIDQDGFFWACGFTHDGDITYHAHIIKLDHTGNVVFSKKFTEISTKSTYLYKCAVDSENRLYIVGGIPKENGLIIKLDEDYNIDWTAGEEDGFVWTSIALNEFGRILAAGYSRIEGNRDWRIIKLDKNGQELFSAHYAFPPPEEGVEVSRDIAIDKDNNVVTVGRDEVADPVGGTQWKVIKLTPVEPAVNPNANVDPSVIIGGGTAIEEDVVIKQNTVVGESCSIGEDAVIKEDCIIGNNVTIGTNVDLKGDCVVGDSVSIAAGVTLRTFCNIDDGTVIGLDTEMKTNVDIGENVIIGTGVVIKENTIIEDGTSIGNNTVIKKNVHIGKNCQIGNDVLIKQDITIPDETVILDGNTVQ